MTSDTTSSVYVNAITSERIRYQREWKQCVYGTQKMENVMDAHARKCARIIAQAYRAGDHPAMWQALSKATRNDMYIPGAAISRTIRHTISMAGWDEQHINEAALGCDAFAHTAHDDATSAQTSETPAGAWILLDHLTGNANRDKTVAGLNAAAIGEHATMVLTASGNLPTLAAHPKRYSNSFSSLAVGAYLAGEHAARDFHALTQVGRIIFQWDTETKYSVYPAHYGVVRALCGSVTSAAQRWRQTITDAEEQGDTKREVAARCAHMMLASALLEHGELTPSDLATLIDTFQEQELMRVRTKEWTYSRTMHVRENKALYDMLLFPTINVDKLIDYAATRMSVS